MIHFRKDEHKNEHVINFQKRLCNIIFFKKNWALCHAQRSFQVLDVPVMRKGNLFVQTAEEWLPRDGCNRCAECDIVFGAKMASKSALVDAPNVVRTRTLMKLAQHDKRLTDNGTHGGTINARARTTTDSAASSHETSMRCNCCVYFVAKWVCSVLSREKKVLPTPMWLADVW